MEENEEKPSIPREMMERLTNSKLGENNCSLRMKAAYSSLLQLALTSKLVSDPTVSSSTNSRLFVITRRRSGQVVSVSLNDRP